MNTRETILGAFTALAIAAVLCAFVFGSVQCNKQDNEAFKACIAAGHQPNLCPRTRY